MRMGSTQESSHQMLKAAESWSEAELEEKYQELIEAATSSLNISDSSPEVKLDCIRWEINFFYLYLYVNNSMMYRWIADKLVGFVPVFELEDSILKPFLHSVLEYLEVVISECLEEDETDNKVRVITLNLKYIVVTFRFCICL